MFAFIAGAPATSPSPTPTERPGQRDHHRFSRRGRTRVVPDGQKLLFTRERTQTRWMTDADGSIETPLPILGARHANWSPDGQKVVFARSRGSAAACTPRISTAPTSGLFWLKTPDLRKGLARPVPCRGAHHVRRRRHLFHRHLHDSRGRQRPVGADRRRPRPEWSPAGHRIMYDTPRNNFVGLKSTPSILTAPAIFPEPVDRWRKRGRDVVAGRDPRPVRRPQRPADHRRRRWRSSQITFFSHYQPDWQPLPPLPPADPGYPRPKGATPLSVPLVPAYRACTNPNRTHGPPLASGHAHRRSSCRMRSR